MIALALLIGAVCGTERWSVKTATDLSAGQIAPGPSFTDINFLTSQPAPSTLPANDRVAPYELATFQLTNVTLLKYALEDDSDYHLVLSDGTHTMIAEIPDPACAGASSPQLSGIQLARSQFDARHAPVSTVFTNSGETVTVRGVGFFDFNHSQNGVAPNAIELHPVVAICFGAGCSPTGQPPPAAQTSGCATASPALLACFALFLLHSRSARRARAGPLRRP